MQIGQRGYLIEVGLKGIRDDKWLKPPLYELIDIQKGTNVTHFIFKSVAGKYKRTLVSSDFALGEWVFAETPEQIQRPRPKFKTKAGDISRHVYMTKFNRGGFPV